MFQCLPLVELFLTTHQCDVYLCPSMWVDKHERWHDGKAHLLASLLQFAYLAFGEQQLAVAFGLVVGIRTVEIGRNVHALYP